MADKEANRYGIGEWYGSHIENLTKEQRKSLSSIKKTKQLDCPFRPKGLFCNKSGGVCSLTTYSKDQHTEDVSIKDDKLVTTCPNRFWQNNLIFREISKEVIETEHPILIPEVGFLQGVDSYGKSQQETVGRLDLILANVSEKDDSIQDWCALEIQAVYFSGKSMGSDIKKINSNGGEIVFPTGIRRPDFRSSGPKRLMPQLQIKVPTLRRWGKKMAVVIDDSFFQSMAPMQHVPHISNADILWLVVDYDENQKIYVKRKVYTTLESSVEGLTAGIPVSLDDFEEKIHKSLKQSKKILTI